PVAVPTDLLQAHPGGLTAGQVGTRAATTSWSAKASEETLRGASARVDEAWAAYLPRLNAIGKYTRLSDFTPPTIFNTGGFNLVATRAAAGTAPAPNQTIAFPLNASFPFFVLDNWLLQAGITIPISDYFLKIDQSYSAATRSEDAARWDIVTARTTAGSNGEIAYYTWLRNRGAVIVAVESLNDQKTHLRDANNQFAVGNVSKADVLRAETSVASAELAVERAKNLADLSEKQLRVAIHASDEEGLAPGEDLETVLPPEQGNLKQLVAESLSARPEVKSADANAAAARQQAAAAKAGRYPVLSAFADGILGNPNPRQIPPSNVWFGTWDLGAQVTWSPNDVLLANGSISDAQSRAAAIEANKNTVRDNIEIEVTQAWQGVREADFSIDTGHRELVSAEEAYRVQRELFNNGRGTSATLTDAETDLTRARLDLLNAKADARIARIRLAHALGRDVAPSR
ncbi:MAG TPA: TolC family protein, partial [Polyangiaceae bacterium]|nr:TolC family protein [Polyangiaceae bacterium]